jgi:CAP12/Pycsar effector protein, TIR domain
MARPSIFIGSSTEGLEIAQVLQAELEREVEGTLWYQGVFGLSQSGLEALEAKVRTFDFAALVLTPDDLVLKRGKPGAMPRDNVLLEAGLFIGALGRQRVFLVSCRDDELDLPTDLLGITLAQFNRREDGNLRAAVGPAATGIREAIRSGPSRPMEARPEAERDREERGHVLSLAHEVRTELETNRYHLDDAKQRRRGWGTDDMLQAAKFDKWQKDPQAAFHTDVMEALRGIYVWQHQKNKEMQRREAAAWNAIGTTTPVIEDLGLHDRDIRDLEEGMRRIVNAQHRLDRLIRDLTEVASAQRSEASPPAAANVGAERVEANRQENGDAQEALAIGMKPSFGVRTILGVDRGAPTGELFLEVNNTSGWTARDVRLEVRRRDGQVDTESRNRMQPDRHFEPRWNVLLRGVKPATVDVFAEVREQFESVVLSYSDERDIARYELRLPTANVGDPFDPATGEERRLR